MPYKDPEKRKAQNRDRMRAKRAAQKGAVQGAPRVRPSLVELKLDTAHRILETLAAQALEVDAAVGESSAVERARTIGYLCSVAIRAIETGGLEARIEQVEALLREMQRAQGPVALPSPGRPQVVAQT